MAHLNNNIGSLDVRREVVVLAIQNNRDRVVSVQLIYQVICRLRCTERVRVAIGLVGGFPVQ